MKNNSNKIIKKRKISGGFTLVELLATLAILSLVSVIVMYTATNVINNAKEKSYLVTINNIQKESGTYVLENDKNIMWLGDGNDYVYQCVTVQNLIDMGYFDNNILDSKISEDRNVLASDYIYIEKDNETKTITKQVLLYDDTSDLRKLCGDYINAKGIINFYVPDGWAKSKDVTITYELNASIGDSDNYIYSYEYTDESILPGSGAFTTSRTVVKNITDISVEGNLYADIKKLDGESIYGDSRDVTGIDTVGPEITEDASSDEARGKVTIPIRIIDRKNNSNTECVDGKDGNCGSGLDKSKISVEDFQVSIGGYTEDIEVTLNEDNCDSNGNEINYCTYNLNIKNYTHAGDLIIKIEGGAIVDNVGNPNVATELNTGITFDNTYKIKYYANGGSGSMSDTICTYGKDCSLSENKFTRKGYTFVGWDEDSNSKNASYDETYLYTPDLENEEEVRAEIKLYAIWKANTVTVKFNVNEGTIKPSTTYENKDYTWATDSNGLISRTYNGKTSKEFYKLNYGSSYDLPNPDGSYMKVTKPGYSVWEGSEWECSSGNCINQYYNDQTDYSASQYCNIDESDCTIELKVRWKVNTYTIEYRGNGGTFNNTDTWSNTATYNEKYTVRTNFYTRKGYTFLGWTTNSDGTDDGNGWTGWNGTWTFVDGQYGISSKKLVLYARWRINKVYINYQVRDDETYTDGENSPVISVKDNLLYENNSLLSNSISYGGKLGSHGLVNYDYSPNFVISKVGHQGEYGEEWVCLSGDCKDKTYRDLCSKDSTDCQYAASDFCDASEGDCTVVLGVNWRKNVVTINYHADGGNLKDGTDGDGYILDSSYVTLGGSKIATTINYGEKIGKYGLTNYDNDNNFVISKTGHYVESGKEWCLSSDCKNKVYSQASGTTYSDSDFCNASSADCTVTLKVRWVPKVLKVIYHANVSGGDFTSTQTFKYGVSGNRFGYNPDGTVYFEGTGQFGSWDRPGYTLLGWAHTATATTNNYSPYSYVSDKFIEGYYPEVDLYAVWRVNDTTPPTCTISATKNKTEIVGNPSSDAVYYGWDATYSGTNSTKKTVDKIDTITYYVWDAAGNRGSCSASITQTSSSKYCPNGYSSYTGGTNCRKCSNSSSEVKGTCGCKHKQTNAAFNSYCIAGNKCSCNGHNEDYNDCYTETTCLDYSYTDKLTSYSCDSDETYLSYQYCFKAN